MVRDDPLASARALAEDLGAVLAVGGADTEAAVDRLLAACYAGNPAPDQALDIEQLRAAMRRAELIRDRTRARVARELCATLNTDLAIHPDTLRRAADELRLARWATTEARGGHLPNMGHTSRRVAAAGGAALVLAGLALGLIGPPAFGVAVVATGLLAGAAGWWAARRAASRAARRAVPGLAACEHLARRRWEQLAGREADPGDVDSVIRRYDPQQPMVTDLLGQHPAVRAVDHVAALRRAAWVWAWRSEVGDLASPPLRPPTPVTSPSVSTEAPTRRSAAPSVPPVGTVVVAAPYTELSDVRAKHLHQRLLRVPTRCRVIVVLGPDLEPRQRTVVDLTEVAQKIDVDLARSGPNGDQAVTVVGLRGRP